MNLQGTSSYIGSESDWFVLLRKRWVVERSFAWAARFRRLARDHEGLDASMDLGVDESVSLTDYLYSLLISHKSTSAQARAANISATNETATKRALIAGHHENILLLSNLCEPFTNGVTFAQRKDTVVKKENAYDISTVVSLFQLRQDHRG